MIMQEIIILIAMILFIVALRFLSKRKHFEFRTLCMATLVLIWMSYNL